MNNLLFLSINFTLAEKNVYVFLCYCFGFIMYFIKCFDKFFIVFLILMHWSNDACRFVLCSKGSFKQIRTRYLQRVHSRARMKVRYKCKNFEIGGPFPYLLVHHEFHQLLDVFRLGCQNFHLLDRAV